MKVGKSITDKIFLLPGLQRQIATLRFFGKSVVFTNGCFDILHPGHLASLTEASAQGDYLIVGLNSDDSVRKLKGPGRPVNPAESRALILASLSMVDAVIVFSEDTPAALIRALLPDVLVKGGDYKVEEIAGAEDVIRNGGRVVINPIVPGYSTSLTINKIAQNQ